MRKIVVACALLVLGTVAAVEAGPPATSCCACFIPDHDSQVPAIFCISTDVRGQFLAERRCEETPDANFLCVATASESAVSPDCVEELLAENIRCPGVNSVPAIGVLGLVVVAGVLSLLGAMTLRRRSDGGPS
jgi:hypothetical protein